MSIYRKEIDRDVSPGYDVVTLAERPNTDYVELKSGDRLDKNMKHYMIDSVISSTIDDNRDPMVAYERAVRLGHDLHFIFPLGTSITSHRREKETYIKVWVGMKIKFEGKFFTIVARNNDNLGLEENV